MIKTKSSIFGGKYALGILTSIFVLMFGATTFGQTTIAVQDFEATPAIPTWTITAGATNISTATGTTDTPASQRIRTGTQSWQVNNGTATLDLANVSTAGYSSIKVTVHISSPSTNTTNGADLTDTLRVFAALNGGSFPTNPDITVTGNNNARWGYNDTVNDTTVAGTPISSSATAGTNQGTIHSTLEITFPNGTNSVALRIIALNNAVQEFWSVDDVSISGIRTTAGGAKIIGRVTDAYGKAIKKATVTLSGGDLAAPITVLTNYAGIYNFEAPAGASYVVSVSSGRFRFENNDRVISVLDNVTDIDFVANKK